MMSQLRFGRWLCAVCVAVGMTTGGGVTTALAQPEASTTDLRRENDQLRERVAQLQAQVAERNKRIKELEDRIKELEKGGAPAAPSTQTPAAPTKAPDAPAQPADSGISGPTAQPPEDPFASPESMFAVLVNEYNEAVGALPRESDADTKRYLREVSKWAKASERKHRGNIDWLIQVQKVIEEAGRTTIEYRVLDAASGMPYGTSPSQIALTGRLAKQITDQPTQKTWKLQGTVSAKPIVNPDRAEPTLFNVPKLIGPYAEFGFDVSATTLTAVLAPGRPATP